MLPRKPIVARSIEDALERPSFAEYMERCLHDRRFGYYATGKVEFGIDRHYWTYPNRMSPLFGWMVAESLHHLLVELLRSGDVPRDACLTVLEFGAGDGDLAHDVLDRIDLLSELPQWRELAPRIRYVIGEQSHALRRRQRTRLARHIDRGRAEVRCLDARMIEWEGPFYGVVLCNELISAFACERFRVHAPYRETSDPGASRVHVVGTVRDREPLTAKQLWSMITEGRGDRVELTEMEVPLSHGWLSGSEVGESPTELLSYLERLAPFVADLENCGLLPADLFWSPHVAEFTRGLGELLTGPDRRGVALLIDYGGSSRHVLDPRSRGFHLRVYGEDDAIAHQDEPYGAPGQLDITWDIDFTELARCGADAGLSTFHYGHQKMLESSEVDLDSPRIHRMVIDGREAEGYPPGGPAEAESDHLIALFREASGFRTAILAPDGFGVPESRFGPSDPLDGVGLETVAASVTPQEIAGALAHLDIDEAARSLVPCCDIVANLSDFHAYAKRWEVLTVLVARDWLRAPGKCGS